MCFSCHGLIGAMEHVPQTVDALRALISRERRQQDRRHGAEDYRSLPRERRVGERREQLADGEAVDDDMIIEVTFDTETLHALSFEEPTEIRRMPDSLAYRLAQGQVRAR